MPFYLFLKMFPPWTLLLGSALLLIFEKKSSLPFNCCLPLYWFLGKIPPCPLIRLYFSKFSKLFMAFYPLVMIHKTCFLKSVAQNITVYTHYMQNGLNIARNIHWLAVPILLIYWISTLPFYKEQISPAPLLDLKKYSTLPLY